MKYSSIMAFATLLGFTSLLCGCDGGGGGVDIGDNDPDVIVCIGDSITEGYACEGLPYPTYLATLVEKKVRNAGVGGTTMVEGVSSAKAALGIKPGYMCIMYGSNDAIHDRKLDTITEALTEIIELCRKNQTIPFVGLPPPQVGGHKIFNGNVIKINEAIKNTCDELGVKCVDIYNAFGEAAEDYLTSDGLHPNAEGSLLIAQEFADCF